MNRTLLEQAFAPAQIKQRRGRNGLLDYVEGWSVIARLNEAFEGAWSFEVVAHEVRDEEVLVLGKLAADGVVKMQFGASQVTSPRRPRSRSASGRTPGGRVPAALRPLYRALCAVDAAVGGRRAAGALPHTPLCARARAPRMAVPMVLCEYRGARGPFSRERMPR